jgi:hypothetical protein
MWTVEIVFDETPDTTQATATLRMGDAECAATGNARRNPHDPSVPIIGEELAAARALSQLSSKLVDESAGILESHLGRHVELTR